MGCHFLLQKSFWPRDQTSLFCLVGIFFTTEPSEKSDTGANDCFLRSISKLESLMVDLDNKDLRRRSRTSLEFLWYAFPTVAIPLRKSWAGISQFSSVAQSCPTLCDPMNCSTPGLPVHHQLPELTQTHAHQVGIEALSYYSQFGFPLSHFLYSVQSICNIISNSDIQKWQLMPYLNTLLYLRLEILMLIALLYCN